MKFYQEIARKENMANYGFGPDAMKKIKVCRKCGEAADAQEQFCRTCGTRLPEETLFDIYKAEHLICERCATVISETAHFCPKCGEKVK